jgi:thiol-disulfide isomerase/thioredoxin
MRLLLAILFSSISYLISAQAVYYSNINNNRISGDSIIQLIHTAESTNPEYKYRAVIVDSTFNNDSIIYRVVFERSKNEEFSSKIQRSKYLDLVGKPFPWNFLNKLDSSSQFLNDTTKLKLVNFWFTACAPCLAEIPFLNQLKTEFSKNIEFFAFTFESSSRVVAFLSNTSFEFNHFVDARYQINQLGIEAYPITFLLDENSKILKVYSGFLYQDSIIEPYSSNAKALISQLKKHLCISTLSGNR